ncbi:hypothetical protein N7456_004781 [Penicillium angulare]|uniref:F-box domain-containing protein n=1 Tax=Penicillium angulare TaxID=116970 RepID=A0A9W9KJI3_9EURO|nr:hypothetical protein N7456_004781 [Penicillium angulare]
MRFIYDMNPFAEHLPGLHRAPTAIITFPVASTYSQLHQWQTPPSTFSTLPLELWQDIRSYPGDSNRQSLRLACKPFNESLPLRVDRVFLSANPLSVEVFRNLASHERFRHQVTEIVWDEARLKRSPPRTNALHEGHELFSDEDGQDDNDLEIVFESLCNGKLRGALSEAKELQELHASVSDHVALEEECPDMLLHRMIPIEQWQDLRHFELSGFVICQSDLSCFLNLFPKSVRSIELVGIRMSLTGISEYGRGRWVEKEVQDFIYGQGQDPSAEDLPGDIPQGLARSGIVLSPALSARMQIQMS